MCEFSRKLIAWLDGELPVDEVLALELHLDACGECRHELRTYERLSGALDAYCDATMEASTPRSELRWKATVLGAGAVAAVLALVLVPPHLRETQPSAGVLWRMASPPPTRVVAATTAQAGVVIPSPPQRARSGVRTQVGSTGLQGPENLSSLVTEEKGGPSSKTPPRFEDIVRKRDESALTVRATPASNWPSPEPAIQITIPADAVLPPGAAPEGASFIAEVSIAPDGSAQEVFLRP